MCKCNFYIDQISLENTRYYIFLTKLLPSMFKHLSEFLCAYPSSSFRQCFAAQELRSTAESLQPFIHLGCQKKKKKKSHYVSKGDSINHILCRFGMTDQPAFLPSGLCSYGYRLVHFRVCNFCFVELLDCFHVIFCLIGSVIMK